MGCASNTRMDTTRSKCIECRCEMNISARVCDISRKGELRRGRRCEASHEKRTLFVIGNDGTTAFNLTRVCVGKCNSDIGIMYDKGMLKEKIDALTQ